MSGAPASPAHSRREFLRFGGATGLLALAAWQLWGKAAGGAVSLGEPPRAFASWQLATLERACAAALDDADAGIVTARTLDTHFATTGAPLAADFALALSVLEFAHAGRRYSRRTLSDAAATLEDWSRSGLAVRRQIARALRDAARFTWFSREETWEAFGYDGPWVGR